MRQYIFAAILAAAATAPVQAQLSASPGLVTVNVQNVALLNNFLNGAQIAALNSLNVPVTVQAPIGVAANVCGVSAAVLGKSGGTNPTCTAKSGSKALAQLVNRQLLSQKK